MGVAWGGGWGNFWLGPGTKMDMLRRQMKNFTIRFKEYNPEIMLNPPAQYLRKYNFHASHLLLAMNAVIFFFIRCLLLFEYCKDEDAALLRCI